MIEGLRIKDIKVNSDVRGNFREVLREDEGLISKLSQVSIGVTLPGVIKAFHWHERQDDTMYVLGGKVLMGLYDGREDSQTKGNKEALILSDERPQMIVIPRGVYHGYKVLGEKPAQVLYIMNNCYDPKNPDEGRVPYDDPKINFDWSRNE